MTLRPHHTPQCRQPGERRGGVGRREARELASASPYRATRDGIFSLKPRISAYVIKAWSIVLVCGKPTCLASLLSHPLNSSEPFNASIVRCLGGSTVVGGTCGSTFFLAIRGSSATPSTHSASNVAILPSGHLTGVSWTDAIRQTFAIILRYLIDTLGTYGISYGYLAWQSSLTRGFQS